MNRESLMRLAHALTLLGVALCDGCVSPPTPQGMTPAAFTVQRAHPFSVTVQVEGGRESRPRGTDQVSNAAFGQAISDAIARCGVFRTVLQSGTGNYRLEVSIVNLDQPGMGFDMTAELKTRWKLTRAADGKVVFQEIVTKAYTATVSDAFVGAERVILAIEGAARENIAEGIRRLSRLDLEAK